MKQTKNALIKLRVQTAEKEAFQSAAELAGISLSAWTRERLRKVAKTELESAGHKVSFIRSRKWK